MKFSVITLFPEMIEANFKDGVVAQARKKGLLEISTTNPRAFTEDFHKSVDDRPFGGGDGMVMLPEILAKAFKSLSLGEQRDAKRKVVYLSPQGSVFTHNKAKEWSKNTQEIIFLCGRYAGVDQRVINEFIDEEVSIGDYVLSGGELAACVMIDAVARQLPGVLGHEQSASLDSFSDGLLEAPLFTRPKEAFGQIVPEVLLSGNHKLINDWRRDLSILVTLKKRPELVEQTSPADLERAKKTFAGLSEAEKKALGFGEWKP